MVTFKLSSKASVGNGSCKATGDVKSTLFGMICPSITLWSINSGLGGGCTKYKI